MTHSTTAQEGGGAVGVAGERRGDPGDNINTGAKEKGKKDGKVKEEEVKEQDEGLSLSGERRSPFDPLLEEWTWGQVCCHCILKYY